MLTVTYSYPFPTNSTWNSTAQAIIMNVACADLKFVGSASDNCALIHFLVPPESLRRVRLKPKNAIISATAESYV